MSTHRGTDSGSESGTRRGTDPGSESGTDPNSVNFNVTHYRGSTVRVNLMDYEKSKMLFDSILDSFDYFRYTSIKDVYSPVYSSCCKQIAIDWADINPDRQVYFKNKVI